MPYHTIIVGLGAMGSAAAYHLARRGVMPGAEDEPSPRGPGIRVSADTTGGNS